MLWERSYGPSEPGTGAYNLCATADGGYVVSGQVGSRDNSGFNGSISGYALKVCADGDSVWYHRYRLLQGTSSYNYLWGFVAAADGGFAGAGFVHPRSPDTGTQAAWIMKIDANGYLQAGGAPPSRSCVVGLPEGAADAAGAVVVWPNPAPDGRFTVQLPPAWAATGTTTYTVADVVGRTVAAGPLRGGETLVDLSAAPAGIYLLRLTWPNGRTNTQKLLR